MLKRNKKVSAYRFFAVIAYTVISGILLSDFFLREPETTSYDMGVTWTETSEVIGDTPDYRQWFYTPCDCSGLQLTMATDQTEAEKDLVVCIYDTSNGGTMREHVISYEDIKDNGCVNVMFGSYTLAEGKQCYFEVYTKGEGDNPLRFWMGTTDSEFCLDVEYQSEEIAGKSIAFNLLYDYTNERFVEWMFVSILFLLVNLKLAEVKE